MKHSRIFLATLYLWHKARAKLAVGLTGVVVFSSAGFLSFNDGFAPDAELWPEWQAHDPASEADIEYDSWERILSRYVQTDDAGVARFAYGAVTPEDRQALDNTIDVWSTLPISEYSRAEQLPYWINLYNALTVQLIIEHYPVASIQDIDISPGLFSSGPWDAERITVEGRALTLNDIEHRILRPIWADARLHYALNCASVGCPNLRAVPWRAADMDAALDQAAAAYVNHWRGFHIDDAGHPIVSKIYAWFVEDFGGDQISVLAHLRQYAAGETAATLGGVESLHGSAYDWSINAYPGAPQEEAHPASGAPSEKRQQNPTPGGS